MRGCSPLPVSLWLRLQLGAIGSGIRGATLRRLLNLLLRQCLLFVRKASPSFPFENLSRDPDNAYFADGIQEEILTRLAKIADLKVISRTSTQRYQSKPGNVPEIFFAARLLVNGYT